MKKKLIFAAVAALLPLASCKVEQPEQIDNPVCAGNTDSPVFTASIAGATKTTIDVTDGKIAWEADDEITVADASSQSAVYRIQSIDAATGKASFVIKAGQAVLGEGPYSATYGTAPTASQTYSGTAGDLPMAAGATSDNNFVFTALCGLMKLNLTQAFMYVSSIEVTGIPEGGSETTYTLTCDPAQDIHWGKDFYISLPQGEYSKIVISNSEGWKFAKTVKSAPLSVLTNHIKPVTFTSLGFCPNQFEFEIVDAYPDEDPQGGVPAAIWGIQW